MLEPFDPYIENMQTQKEVPELIIQKKGNSLFGAILLVVLGAIIAGIVINEKINKKRRMIELKQNKRNKGY